MIRALLADDEAPARDRLRRMLEHIDDVEIVGEAEDGPQAVEQIAALNPSLVFLDIEMPGLNGMQVAAALQPPRPAIVFCTAYDEYAIEAFENHATDYLLKPISGKRLNRTLARVRANIAERSGMAQEIAAASATQQQLLTPLLPTIAGLELAGYCHALRGVGGDYYDFIGLSNERVGIVLADVSGKGLYAALLAANLQARVQECARRHDDDLVALAGEVNNGMHAVTEDNRYATFFYARIDVARNRLSWVNGAHPAPLLLHRGSETTMRLESSGTAIGMLADASYDRQELTFSEGDILIGFSDGASEATDSFGNELGTEAICAIVRPMGEKTVDQIRDAIVDTVLNHAGGEAQDDLTVIVCRRVAT